MTTTIVTPEKHAIIAEIEIAAPPARVFQALTRPEQLMLWWTDASCKAEVWRFNPSPGERWSARLRSETMLINGFSTFEPNGTVLECDPPRRLAYTWISNWDPQPTSTTVVTWELIATATGTRIKLTHSELTEKLAEDYRNGWPSVMRKLKSFIEQTGENMATSFVTTDQDAIISEIEIAAPPERVFTALSDPGQLKHWFGSEECPVKSWEFDARLDGAFRYETEAGSMVVNGVRAFKCHGHVTEYDPPKVLAYTWFANWHDDNTARTVVRWELTPRNDGTHVKVTHSGLSNLPVARKDYSGGWPGVVENLKSFVEK